MRQPAKLGFLFLERDINPLYFPFSTSLVPSRDAFARNFISLQSIQQKFVRHVKQVTSTRKQLVALRRRCLLHRVIRFITRTTHGTFFGTQVYTFISFFLSP